MYSYPKGTEQAETQRDLVVGHMITYRITKKEGWKGPPDIGDALGGGGGRGEDTCPLDFFTEGRAWGYSGIAISALTVGTGLQPRQSQHPTGTGVEAVWSPPPKKNLRSVSDSRGHLVQPTA